MEKGSPVPNCFGFIDGTARAICRPSINQEAYYSGHKKVHCLKYQSLITPDGIIVSLKGAYEGRRHDAAMLRDSGLYEELEANVHGNQRFLIYGDQGYGLRELLLRPYTQHEIGIDPARQLFNNAMRSLRISVEWGFNKIIQIFAFLDFKKNQKLLVQDLQKMYRVGTILTNCHTCLYGGETSQYFQVKPPTLQEYFG